MNEWCGGTVPPTIVTVNIEQSEARVDVYDDERYVHEGVIGQPVYSSQLLHKPELPISPDLIRRYAANCIASFVAENTGK